MESLCISLFVISFLCLSCSAEENIIRYSITEELPNDTFVGNVGIDGKLRETASAEDYSHIRYSILSEGNSYENLFYIDSGNGSIYTDVNIDRETITDCAYGDMKINCVLLLNVAAQSKISAYFRKLEVAITIIDVNDHAPSFPVNSTSLLISELATLNSSVTLVAATDADSGNNSLQRYYLKTDTDAKQIPFNTSFESYVDGSLLVKLVITGNLDREIEDSYQLTVVAEDNGTPKKTGIIMVNITIEDSNDNPPVFDQLSYNVTLQETTAPGTEILGLAATDADLGINGEIIYRLSRNQLGKIHELFAINETSGALSVNGNFNSGGEFRVIVEASDNGLQPLMSQTVVMVTVLDSNNNRPEININLFSEDEMAKVSEYADIGTVVAHIGLIDRDTGINGIIECDISSDESLFKLQAMGINEYKVIVNKGLDREIVDYIYVVISCQDKGSPPMTSFAEFTVQVLDENDNSPAFLQEIYFIDISENNAINTDIVQVSALDLDSGKNGEISYSLWATGFYQFYMDPHSGFIKTMSVFDRENATRVTLYAYAKDNGSPQRTSTATIVINVLDRNDNDPQLNTSYEFTVSENLAIGASVGKINATDRDVDQNGQLGFIIDVSLPFNIDSSGLLKTRVVLDREERHRYHFIVTCYDHGVPARNATTSVIVTVQDTNDHAPIFIFPDAENYTVILPFDTLPTTVVTKIKAYDLDDGKNGQLFFSFQNTNTTNLFKIDGFTGEITLTRPLLDSDREIYYMLLEVHDNGNPRQSATTSMGIFIARQEEPPKVTDTKGENLLIAITIGTVTFVLVFTIVLVIVILKRRGGKNKNNTSDNDEDRFYDKPPEKRVQFADINTSGSTDNSTTVAKEILPVSMTTFNGDVSDGRESELSPQTDKMDAPILDKHKFPQFSRKSPMFPDLVENHSTSGHMDKRQTPTHSEFQLPPLQTHSTPVKSSVNQHSSFLGYGADDNHSQTSAETATSDSGRGGSVSDIHSTSLSQSHDSEMKPFRSTYNDISKPWMNLADLQFHPCNKTKSNILKQLNQEKLPRLQLKNFNNDKNNFNRGRVTQSHTGFDRSKFVTFQEPLHITPPASDVDRSFMTYDDDDDDGSTTTSGSYTIDQEDLSIDMHSPGLHGCLV